MLAKLLLSLSCSLITNVSYYESPIYVGIREIQCSSNLIIQNLNTEYNDEQVSATLNIVTFKDKTIIKNIVKVKRPWIAPVDLFVSIAKDKQDDKLSEELDNILNTKGVKNAKSNIKF